MKKIVICGGHHNSALVVAEKLLEKGHQVFWFGHKYSMIGDKNPSAEFLEVSQKGIPFVEIRAGKWQPSSHFWQNLFRIPLGFWQSFSSLFRLKPNLVFSFGGYLALPVACSAYILRIPVVTHEQTTIAGWANKIIARMAKKVFITYESSAKYFPQEKVILTGLPLREEIFRKGKKLFSSGRKTIYVTGGKQGAHVINEAVFQILPQLLEKFNVIHQIGSTTVFNDIEKGKKIKEDLGDKGKYYLIKEYFFEEEIGAVFNTADLVISRAGAHIVYELMSLKKPAILIPIPSSSHQEQLKNAQMLKSLVLTEILNQDELQKGKLWETISEIEKKLGMKKNEKKNIKSTGLSSTSIILQELESLLR